MDTSLIFFIIAALLIVILLVYSIWAARREKSRIFSSTFSTRQPASPINTAPVSDIPDTLNSATYTTSGAAEANEFVPLQEEVAADVEKIKIRLPGETSSQQSVVVAEPQQAQRQPEPQPQPVVEPQSVEAPQMIMLYVVAAEGQQFSGQQIYTQLETFGLQFGEHQIFHRHLDSSPASPVIFSVANMLQPGVFDLTQLAHFHTTGLLFFMYLPSVGNDLSNLKVMIRTAESFAHAMGGFVLNEQYQLFDENSREQYLRRVIK